jgi:hypothetical protein
MRRGSAHALRELSRGEYRCIARDEPISVPTPSGVCWPRTPGISGRSADELPSPGSRRASVPRQRNEAVVLINKTEIMALLLSRGSEERAAWVDRELPGLVDSDIHSALLELLHVDVSTMSDASEQQTEHRT